MGFQQNHFTFACLFLWGLRFYYQIEHCALALSSTHMRPLILVSPITKFSLLKESLVRIGEVFHNSRKKQPKHLITILTKRSGKWKNRGEKWPFLVFWAQIWPKNRSKYKIWILNTSDSLWKWSNKPVFQLHILKLLVTTISKAIENQQFWKKKLAVFWFSEPRFGPNFGQKLVQT